MTTKIIHGKLFSYISMHCKSYRPDLQFIHKNGNVIKIINRASGGDIEFRINDKDARSDDIIKFLRGVLPEYTKLGKEIL